MMKQVLFLLFLVSSLLSCNKNKVPGSIIQPDKMGNVLWDVMRVQFLADELAIADSSIKREEELNDLTNQVFKIHKTTSAKFDKSYDWYVKHPDLLKRIFDSIQVQKERELNSPEVFMDDSTHGPIRHRLKPKDKALMPEVE